MEDTRTHLKLEWRLERLYSLWTGLLLLAEIPWNDKGNVLVFTWIPSCFASQKFRSCTRMDCGNSPNQQPEDLRRIWQQRWRLTLWRSFHQSYDRPEKKKERRKKKKKKQEESTNQPFEWNEFQIKTLSTSWSWSWFLVPSCIELQVSLEVGQPLPPSCLTYHSLLDFSLHSPKRSPQSSLVVEEATRR